jgi:rod shape-determining protein MreD
MAETLPPRLWLRHAVFLLLAFALVFLKLLPLNTTPRILPFPDLLLLITCLWAVRRPDYLSVISVAAVFLLADFLFQRPPGLMAALAVVATEGLRARAPGLRAATFGMEWLTVALAILAVTLAGRFALAIVMMPQAPLGLTLLQMIVTILTYPLAVALAWGLFGITRPALGEVNALGQRL